MLSLPPAHCGQNGALEQRLTNHVRMLGETIGARSLARYPIGLSKAASYIESELKNEHLPLASRVYKISDRLGRRESSLKGKSARNIVATIRGATAPNDVIVIGAHYDSVYSCPGANDNATGVAALIEIAKALAHKKFARTLQFVAFTNEEPPFFRTEDMGSYRFARDCYHDRVNVVGMLALETMGYYSAEANSQRFPPGLAGTHSTTGNFIAFVANQSSAELAQAVTKSFQEAVAFPTELVVAPPSVPGVDFSDQQAFWKYKYPALMVTDTAFLRYPDYHRESDTPEKVDCGKLAVVTQGLIQAISALAQPVKN